MPTRIQKRSKLSNLQGATITRHKKENMRSVALPMRACARIVCNSCVLCLFFFPPPVFVHMHYDTNRQHIPESLGLAAYRVALCTTTTHRRTLLETWDAVRALPLIHGELCPNFFCFSPGGHGRTTGNERNGLRWCQATGPASEWFLRRISRRKRLVFCRCIYPCAVPACRGPP